MFINKGNFGKIYKKNINGKIYAIKKYNNIEENFVEIDILTRLNNKHLMSGVLDFPNIVMPYYKYNFVTYKLNKKIPDKKYVKMCLEGLCYLHSNNILHMDIKPENILLNEDNCVLADFGLSKYLTNCNKYYVCDDIIGSPEYMDPILLKNKPRYYSRKTDLYALEKSCEFFMDEKIIFEYHEPEPIKLKKFDPINKNYLKYLNKIKIKVSDFFVINHLLNVSEKIDIDDESRVDYCYEIGIRLSDNYKGHRSNDKKYLHNYKKFMKELLELTDGNLRPFNRGDCISCTGWSDIISHQEKFCDLGYI